MSSERDSVRIRPATVEDAPGIALAHVRSWQTAYRGILPDNFLDALEPSSREERWREALRPPLEDRLTFVAELLSGSEDGRAEIVGFAAAGPERDGIVVGEVAYEGELYAIYLVAEHRRRGTGRRLVAAAAQWLVDRDTRSILIWALKNNRPACSFYEGLGGIVVGEKTITIGPSNLVDVAYGWPDTRQLIAAAQGTAV